jgi:flavin-dependent dehydrogenase
LARAGIDSVIIEKETFPRFRVGEALTGEVGQILRDLGLQLEMDAEYAVKTAGVVIGPNGRNAFSIPTKRRDPVLGLCDTTTWQVCRSTFDELLLSRAAEHGVEVIAGRAVQPVVEDGVVRGLLAEREGGHSTTISADVVVDASGPATFLAQSGVASAKERGRYSRQLAIYSHFAGAKFDDEPGSRNTHILYQRPNHWGWYIPMGADRVSIGVVTPSEYFRDRHESTTEFLARELRELNPGLAERTSGLAMTAPVHATSNFSYQVRRFAGPGFLCIGDAHRFIDPIFAFGVHFAMVEGRRAATAIADCLATGGPGDPRGFADYQHTCELGLDVVQDLIDCFWLNPFAFAVFVHRRYVDDFTDLFAGRVYQDDPSPGLQAVRRLNARAATLGD